MGGIVSNSGFAVSDSHSDASLVSGLLDELVLADSALGNLIVNSGYAVSGSDSDAGLVGGLL